MNIKNNLLKIRQERGLSQPKLAQMSGVSIATISLIECRGKMPTGEVMLCLSEALGVPAVDIFPELGKVIKNEEK